jgi:sulfur dioxygenase
MFFKQLFDPASSTYTYLIADDTTHEAVLIDPVIEQLERDMKVLHENGLVLCYTLETHVHADHVTGAMAVKQASLASTGAAASAGTQTAVSRDCNAQGYDRYLTDGDVILFGHEEILVIATPGHTAGSVSFLWRDRVFTGDTLLIGGCGRTDFQSGSAQALYRSITQKLFTLDDQVLVYPGHDYKGRRVSSIGEERQFNARVAGKSEAAFVDTMDHLNLPAPKRIHEAVPANLAGGATLSPEQAVALNASRSTSGSTRSVSAQQFAATWMAAERPQETRLIDVRTPAEFTTLHIPGAENMPLDRLNPAALLAQGGKDQTIYCICQTGTRSQMAAERLRAVGVRQVVHVDGGTNAWQGSGLPVVQGNRRTISLERQMRITAGSFIVLGVAAGALWHPAGYALSALIGLGLVYAGASNSCGMTMILARMPWNQAKGA